MSEACRFPFQLLPPASTGCARSSPQPQHALVAVDFDGTLAPIVADPALARPHPAASDVLRRLAGVIRAVAVVTGRPAGVASSLLGFTAEAPPANVYVVGHYGFETWTPNAGVVTTTGVDPGQVDAARSALPALLHDIGAPPGTAIEDKGASVAVHVRRTQNPAAALELLRPALSDTRGRARLAARARQAGARTATAWHR